MIGGMSTLRTGIKRFGRPLLGVMVAYAVAAQSLLIALGGCTTPRGLSQLRRSCRPAISILPDARIAYSALPDRIMR